MNLLACSNAVKYNQFCLCSLWKATVVSGCLLFSSFTFFKEGAHQYLFVEYQGTLTSIELCSMTEFMFDLMTTK
jgi:hypothetical protein